MRIAIVTAQFEGLTRNAGIGTAYRRLAELLLSKGHEVEVLFMPIDVRVGEVSARRKWGSKLSALKKLGIQVTIPSDRGVERLPGELGYLLSRSQCVFRHLRERHFDVIHAPDNFGLLYVSLKAKQSGAFTGTRFMIGTHGPRIWHEHPNGPPTAPALLMSKLDQESLELADCVISPSRYMLRYLKQSGWRMPAHVRVIPNVNSLQNFRLGRVRARNVTRSLVFFGRLELRKGVHLFSRAVTGLLKADPSLGRKHPLEIIFLGSDSGKSAAVDQLRREFKPFENRVCVSFLTDCSSEESLRLLKRKSGALICMPSLAENSPYTIVECLESKLDFIATRAGGQAELLLEKDRSKVLCAPNARSLARALRQRLQQAPAFVRPSSAAVRANQNWVRLHQG